MSNSEDQVEQLVNALWYANADSFPDDDDEVFVTATELLVLARAAAAVGARTALEALKLDLAERVGGGGPLPIFSDVVQEWLSQALAAYTTDEETTA